MGKIISIKTLREKNFHTIDVFDAYWTEMFGRPERNFRMAISGPSTSGKSSLALRLADHCAKRWGKVLYNSWEEGHNKTLSDRAIARGVDAPKLHVADRLSFDEMFLKIKRNHYKVIVIDGFRVMNLTFEQCEFLFSHFKQKAFIFIGHGDREGQLESGRDIWKYSDIKVFVSQGRAKINNRYSGETKEFKLFDVKKVNNPTQPQLL